MTNGMEIGGAQIGFQPAPLDAVDADGDEHAQANVASGGEQGKEGGVLQCP